MGGTTIKGKTEGKGRWEVKKRERRSRLMSDCWMRQQFCTSHCVVVVVVGPKGRNTSSPPPLTISAALRVWKAFRRVFFGGLFWTQVVPFRRCNMRLTLVLRGLILIGCTQVNHSFLMLIIHYHSSLWTHSNYNEGFKLTPSSCNKDTTRVVCMIWIWYSLSLYLVWIT